MNTAPVSRRLLPPRRPGLGGWNSQCELAAPAELALDLDRAAHHCRKALADREAEPDAARGVVTRLEELLEDVAEILLRDPVARVGNSDRHLVAVGHRGYRDRATLVRMPDRVGQHVEEDLLHVALIGVHHYVSRFGHEVQGTRL